MNSIDIGPNKIKHLEFIQQVITRHNTNSFIIKGWTITLVSALFAFAAKDSNPKFFWITFISVPLFWSLDAYFLFQERSYVNLFNSVRKMNENFIDFEMDASLYSDDRASWGQSFWSKTICWFYLITLLVIATVLLWLK